jgi:ribosomal protein L37AE/L43A
MNEKRILSVTCPSCASALQVKTRAAEKVFACPKCGAQVTATAGPDAAPQASVEPLVEAALWQEPQQAPGEAPTMIHSDGPGPMARWIGAGMVLALFGIGVTLAMRVGHSRPGQSLDSAVVFADKLKGSGGTNPGEQGGGDVLTPSEGAPSVPPSDGFEPNVNQQPKLPFNPQEGNSGAAAAKAKLDQAASRVQNLQRQKRDWLLANAGRKAASGQRVVWPNERLLDEARRELEQAQTIYEQSKE